MGWQEAPTTPDLVEVIAEAIRTQTLEVTGPNAETRQPTVDRIERHEGRSPRERLDGFLADGMPLAMAVGLTQEWMANGGDATTYRVRKGPDQAADTTRPDRARFAGLYRGAPRVHQSVSCGRPIQGVSPVADTSRARRLAEQWRAMRR